MKETFEHSRKMGSGVSLKAVMLLMAVVLLPITNERGKGEAGRECPPAEIGAYKVSASRQRLGRLCLDEQGNLDAQRRRQGNAEWPRHECCC